MSLIAGIYTGPVCAHTTQAHRSSPVWTLRVCPVSRRAPPGPGRGRGRGRRARAGCASLVPPPLQVGRRPPPRHPPTPAASSAIAAAVKDCDSGPRLVTAKRPFPLCSKPLLQISTPTALLVNQRRRRRRVPSPHEEATARRSIARRERDHLACIRRGRPRDPSPSSVSRPDLHIDAWVLAGSNDVADDIRGGHVRREGIVRIPSDALHFERSERFCLDEDD